MVILLLGFFWRAEYNCYNDVLIQLQDAGCWTDAATLAATHLKGSDYARYLMLKDFHT